MTFGKGTERRKEIQEKTHPCRTPSNRFDFFTAVMSLLVPEVEVSSCRRTFIAFPNSPLPNSPISTNSRSNLPGCARVSKEEPRPPSEARLSRTSFRG
jgi:hypothetical protein